MPSLDQYKSQPRANNTSSWASRRATRPSACGILVRERGNDGMRRWHDAMPWSYGLMACQAKISRLLFSLPCSFPLSLFLPSSFSFSLVSSHNHARRMPFISTVNSMHDDDGTPPHANRLHALPPSLGGPPVQANSCARLSCSRPQLFHRRFRIAACRFVVVCCWRCLPQLTRPPSLREVWHWN